jgi:hypothetical protein
MIIADPLPADIINASATATTTGIVTVPGGRNLTATVQMSASVTGVGTAEPVLTFHVPAGTTGAAPADGSILARMIVGSILSGIASDSNTTEIFVYGGDNGCTLNFTAGAAGSSSIVINGFLE